LADQHVPVARVAEKASGPGQFLRKRLRKVVALPIEQTQPRAHPPQCDARLMYVFIVDAFTHRGRVLQQYREAVAHDRTQGSAGRLAALQLLDESARCRLYGLWI